MSDNPVPPKQGRSTINRILLALPFVLLFCCGPCSLNHICLNRVRPVFYQFGSWTRPTWYLIQPVKDQWGNVCYFDYDRNMVVLIGVGSSDQRISTPQSSHHRAFFEVDGDRKITVDVRDNTLFIFLPDGEEETFVLDSSSASSLQLAFFRIFNSSTPPEPSLLKEIINHYKGPDKEELKNFMSKGKKT